ncbi:MAG: hypothetical protein R3B45_11655 [Bdellovibrionota bacterium]
MPQKQQLSFDNILARGQALYDKGDMEQALIYASKAYQIDPTSEKAALLLGYANLGNAGIQPFDLILKMISSGEKDSNSEEEANLAEDDSNPLNKLKDVIGITEEELSLLGTIDDTFPEYPVIIPICADEARYLIEKLSYLNQAILVICPLVDPTIRLAADNRHNCSDRQNPTLKNSAKAHLLWAMSHIAEALAFYSVLTVSTDSSSSKTNLEMRFEALKSSAIESPAELTNFLSQLDGLEQIILKTMPLGTECSPQYPQTQFAALVNDLVSASSGFNKMAGTPKSITSALEKATAKIQIIKSSSNDTAAAFQERNAAFKSDLTKKLSTSLSEKINQLGSQGQTLSQEQSAQVCSSYQTISGETTPSENTPSICK